MKTMQRIGLCVLGAAIVAIAGCHAAKEEGEAAQEQAEALAEEAVEQPADFVHEFARESFRALMQQKADTSQAMLRDVLFGDMIGVATKAADLQQISRRAEMEVIVTPEHAMYAARFRESLGEIAAQAERGDLVGVTEAHSAMNRVCLECHAYLRASAGQ